MGRGDPALTTGPMQRGGGAGGAASGVAVRVPTRQSGVPSLPEGVTCQSRAFTWEAEPCQGILGCSPCGHVSGQGVGDEVAQAGPSKWLTGGGVASAGSPGGAVQPFPVEYPEFPPETSKVQGKLFG